MGWATKYATKSVRLSGYLSKPFKTFQNPLESPLETPFVADSWMFICAKYGWFDGFDGFDTQTGKRMGDEISKKRWILDGLHQTQQTCWFETQQGKFNQSWITHREYCLAGIAGIASIWACQKVGKSEICHRLILRNWYKCIAWCGATVVYRKKTEVWFKVTGPNVGRNVPLPLVRYTVHKKAYHMPRVERSGPIDK